MICRPGPVQRAAPGATSGAMLAAFSAIPAEPRSHTATTHNPSDVSARSGGVRCGLHACGLQPGPASRAFVCLRLSVFNLIEPLQGFQPCRD